MDLCINVVYVIYLLSTVMMDVWVFEMQCERCTIRISFFSLTNLNLFSSKQEESKIMSERKYLGVGLYCPSHILIQTQM